MSRLAVYAMVVFLCAVRVSDATAGIISIVGDPGDGKVAADGVVASLTSQEVVVGTAGNAVQGSAIVYLFELPTLTSGQTFARAQLDFEYLEFSDSAIPEFNVDIFGINARPQAVLESGDYYDGDATLSSDTLIQDAVITPVTVLGNLAVSNRDLFNFLKSLYGEDGTPASNFAAFRLNPDIHLPANSTPYRRYWVATADHDNASFHPRLSLTPSAKLLSNGILNDDQLSIVYSPDLGELEVDAPASAKLSSIEIYSAKCALTGEANCDISFEAPEGGSFGSISFGNAARPALSHDFVLNDLSVIAALTGGGELESVDLVYMRELSPGDANRDFAFDQDDIVQVLVQGSKYLTGQAATWGEGDWDGAPGGYPGEPPTGDGLFDQQDIIAALQAGVYLTGPYGALSTATGGFDGDDQTSIKYDPATGELGVGAPAGKDLTSINITSEGSKFIGDKPAVLDGAFDNFAPDNIFKATFGGMFGAISFGNVLAPGMSADAVIKDLAVVGSLAGGGDLGDVDLCCIPEPSAIVLTLLGLLAVFSERRMRNDRETD